jgi:hypothetical protein
LGDGIEFRVLRLRQAAAISAITFPRP